MRPFFSGGCPVCWFCAVPFFLSSDPDFDPRELNSLTWIASGLGKRFGDAEGADQPQLSKHIIEVILMSGWL